MMNREKIIFITFICIVALSCFAEAKNILMKVEVDEVDAFTRVTINYSRKVIFDEPLILENPHRLLLDFRGKKVFSKEQNAEVKKGLIKKVRFEYKESNLKEKELEYIVMQLHRRAEVNVKKKKRVLVILISSAEKGSRTTRAVSITPLKEVVPRDAVTCLQYALAADPRITIAADEVRLARLKSREALRALFPGIKAKYEQTRGDAQRDTGTPDFDEKTYGVHMNQPLYQGGKLWNTYKQTKLNLYIAGLKYDEMVAEITFEVLSAYYNLVKAQKTFDIFSALSKTIQKDITASRKRYKAKLSTTIEYLTVENQDEQIKYNKASFEKDFFLARLTLAQVLFLPDDTLLHIEHALPYGAVNVSLDETVRFASLNRHSRRIAELELTLKEMGKKIGRSSNAFKVDFSGFAGRSGGAYKSETLDMGEDYSAGIKISKPFGGNTVSSSYLFDKTSPKLGQSTRTQSKTGSVSLSIFDNLKGYSEQLESEIGYERARVKLLEETARIKKEVQESYFNLQKAILQVKAGKSEVSLAKKEVVAVRSKKEHNLAQISELVAARIKLANVEKSLVEALSFYNISLASLNRAAGQADKFVIEE